MRKIEILLISLFLILILSRSFWDHAYGLTFLSGFILSGFYMFCTYFLYPSKIDGSSSIRIGVGMLNIFLGVIYCFSVLAIMLKVVMWRYALALLVISMLLNAIIVVFTLINGSRERYRYSRIKRLRSMSFLLFSGILLLIHFTAGTFEQTLFPTSQ
jgi:hypothetical protein